MKFKIVFMGIILSIFLAFLSCSEKVLETPAPTAAEISNPSLKSAYLKYYVAKTGNNANAGTLSSPWLTIDYALSKIHGGDTLIVRAGKYNEGFTIFDNSGTALNPTVIMAYPGETPIIDGTGINRGPGGFLITIYSSYTVFSGFEVTGTGVNNSAIIAIGNYININHCKVHDVIGGIYISGNYCVAEYNEVYNACMDNSVYPGKNGFINSVGMSICRGTPRASYNIMRHNLVHDVWGEGISTFEANYSTIEDNIVHDVWSCNIYVSDASYATVQRNFVYRTYNMIGTGNDPQYEGSQIGILMGDEKVNPGSDHTTIAYNIVYGCKKNFDYWGTNGSNVLTYLYLYNNTFVNAVIDDSPQWQGYHTNILIGGDCANAVGVYIKNNIIVQKDNLITPIRFGTSTLGDFHFSNNLWYTTIAKNTLATGTGDVTGDPKLANILNPYNATSYQITSTSPAIKAGVDVGLTIDFLKNALVAPPPSIGAIEYNSGQASSPSTVYYNVQTSATAVKSDCGTGYTGSTVTYSVAAGKYSSTISQADADSKAVTDLSANKQAYANANGTCTAIPVYYNVQQSGTATKNDCGTGYTGSTVTYIVPANKYSSTISQTDANNLAIKDVNNNKQAYANANGTCTAIAVYYNVQKSGSATKNNCGTGYTGSTVTYVVPANKYSSTVSQTDADNLAITDVNSNKQAYANANGTCTASTDLSATSTTIKKSKKWWQR
jgi:hypothetical protein